MNDGQDMEENHKKQEIARVRRRGSNPGVDTTRAEAGA